LRTAWSGDFNPSKEAARRKLLYLHRVLRLKDLILDRFHIVAKMNKVSMKSAPESHAESRAMGGHRY